MDPPLCPRAGEWTYPFCPRNLGLSARAGMVCPAASLAKHLGLSWNPDCQFPHLHLAMRESGENFRAPRSRLCCLGRNCCHPPLLHTSHSPIREQLFGNKPLFWHAKLVASHPWFWVISPLWHLETMAHLPKSTISRWPGNYNRWFVSRSVELDCAQFGYFLIITPSAAFNPSQSNSLSRE